MATELFHRGSAFHNDAGKWRLRWWVTLALALSLALHYSIYELMQTGLFNAAFRHVMVDKTTAEPVPDRVQINADLLKNKAAVRDLPQEPPPGMDLKNLERAAKGTPENMAKDFGGKDIRFAPAAGENLQSAFSANKPSAADRPDNFDLPDSSSADLSKAMNQLNKASLQNAASDKQLLLDSGGSLSPSERDLLGKDVLGKLNENALAGKGDSAKVPGFSSLDEVLGAGGGIGTGGGPILMPTDLLFSYNSAELAAGARGSMMKLGLIIQKNAGKHFVIEGHTDTFGGEAYNNDLSLRRAEAVKEWLVDTLKIEADLISTEGHGKSRAIVNPRGTVEQQGLNRRVEIRSEG